MIDKKQAVNGIDKGLWLSGALVLSMALTSGCSMLDRSAAEAPDTDATMSDAAMPDMDAAAAELGVSTEDLQEALGTTSPIDYAAAAEKLGVSEEQLLSALTPG